MNDDQLLRYSRQILLADIDIDGQEKLLKSHVIIIGVGGLGSPVALYLAAAGVGEITLVDHDLVDLSNMQRQIAHGMSTIGQPKVSSAKRAMLEINPQCHVNTINEALSESLLASVFESTAYDVIIDCTDNFAIRKLINLISLRYAIPLVSAAAIRLEGQLSVFNLTGTSPCYQCVYPDLDEEALTCSEAGVVGALVGVMGSLQALEVIKIIAGFGETLSGKLMLFDAKYSQWRTLNIKKDKQCKVCAVK